VNQTLTKINESDQQPSGPITTITQHKKNINAAEMRQPYSGKTLAYPIGFAGIN
jgi:hypothetical protein